MTKKTISVSIAAALIASVALGLTFWSDGVMPSPHVPHGALSKARTLGATPSTESRSPADPMKVVDQGTTHEVESELDPVIAAALCGFRGRIVDATNAPVTSCRVRIHRFSFDHLAAGLTQQPDRDVRGPGITNATATTGPDGRFFISAVWPRGTYVLTAHAAEHGRMLRLIDRAPGPGETIELGDLAILGQASITGTVVDEKGAPVAGARIRVVDMPAELLRIAPFEQFSPDGAILLREEVLPVAPVILIPPWLRELYAELPIATTKTDAAGRYRIEGVKPGENTILVDHAPMLPAIAALSVKPRGQHDAGRTELHAGATIRIHALDTNDEPIAGAEILVAPTSTVGPIDFAGAIGRTDADGILVVTGMPRDRITIAIRRSPKHPWRRLAPARSKSDVDVHVPALCDLEFTLRSQTGADVTNPIVELIPGEISRQTMALQHIGVQSPLDLTERLDRPATSQWRVHGLEPGRYVLAVRAKGHARALKAIELPIPEAIEVTLVPERVHDVLVVDRSGAPVRHAEIFAEPNDRRERDDTPLPIKCGRTPANGQLQIVGVTADELRVTATHPAYGTVAVVAPRSQREVVIVFDRIGAIDGRVLSNGAPAPAGRYTIFVRPLLAPNHGVIERAPGIVAVDAEGRFRLEGLQPGTYDLRAYMAPTTPGTLGGLLGTLRGFDEEPSSQALAEVRPDQRTDVRLTIGSVTPPATQTARLSGTVWLNGSPRAGMLLRLRSREGTDVAETKTNHFGEFDSGLVPAGTYRVSVYSPEDSEHTVYAQRHQLEFGKSEHLMVQVETGTLSGVVVDAGGKPAGRAFLDVLRASTNGPGLMAFRIYCDGSGRFEKHMLPAGPYRLRATGHRRHGVAQPVTVDLTAKEKRTLRFELGDGLTIDGSVDREAQELVRAGTLTLRIRRREQLAEGSAWILVGKTSVNRRNRFAFSGLTAGDYSIAIETGSGENLEHDGTIELGSQSVKNLQLTIARK